ncbi:hypothetical protein GCM10007897_21950 [Sphingobium jiangsuense]|nr:hypothetical protein GCM10007897_21950 [Sphingobium jiangsuense]
MSVFQNKIGARFSMTGYWIEGNPPSAGSPRALSRALPPPQGQRDEPAQREAAQQADRRLSLKPAYEYARKGEDGNENSARAARRLSWGLSVHRLSLHHGR